MSESLSVRTSQFHNHYDPYDESLHGFLLRLQQLHYPDLNPIGVISQSGGWVENPFAHKKFEHLFMGFPDHELLEIIDMTRMIGRENNNLFDDPTLYTNRISTTFLSGRNPSKVRKTKGNINYCPHCIRDGIEKHGYGYFRHFWEGHKFCLIHKSPLKELPVLGMKRAMGLVRLVLKGEDPGETIDIPDGHEEYIRCLDYPKRNFVLPIKAAPCLTKPFANWVIKGCYDFDAEICDKYDLSDVRELCIRATKNISLSHKSKILLSKIYLVLSRCESTLMEEFYSEEVDFVLIKIGPRKQGVLREVVSKAKGKCCNQCMKYECFIKRIGSYYSLAKEAVTFNFVSENSYYMKRLYMQGLRVDNTSSYPWSPIFINV
ncbi:hypothetical protein [Ferrimonas balearica]|uniref:hypothetical protein n=1 Tax=Ferrimonas balearica TaxID=44012 RepID=UPI001C5A9032|nr:hypothetical protein [Ferrimonas balearica]MBW3166473.1 hypothetical protein [Ferrimonas balearica]